MLALGFAGGRSGTSACLQDRDVYRRQGGGVEIGGARMGQRTEALRGNCDAVRALAVLGGSTSGSHKTVTKRSEVKNENGGTCQRRALGVYTFDTAQ